MKKILFYTMVLSVFLACKQSEEKKETAVKKTQQVGTTQEENNWIVLFDGSSLENWRGYLTDSIPSEWSVEGDAMVFTPGDQGGKNIISKGKFTNFVLSLEWKISEGGNSGIFWGVYEDTKFGEVYQTGPEIQILDNERHPDAKIRGKLHQAGALYDMVEPSQDVTKPAGEWNQCVITVNHNTNTGNVVMNDIKIVSFPVHGDEWDAMVANSKFKDWEGFGVYRTGHIALQDHGDKVWYRNIKIKEIHE